MDEIATTRVTPASPQKGEAPPIDPLAAEMRWRWQAGDRPRVEDYLASHPELLDQPDRALRLIHEEICLCRQEGQQPTADEVLARFPQWRDRLGMLLECDRLLAEHQAGPQVTAQLEHVLVAILGEGAHGQVYLARQPALANRLVVLKVSPCTGVEHLSLARLQHTHIVPLYSVHDDAQSQLRTLCMPYFGGGSWQRVLDLLRRQGAAGRTGKQIVVALDRIEAEAPVQLPAQGPVRQFLTQASYVQAVCWIGTCLAEALHYAHERGLLHLDVKPANVLLAADGQPMLLDFHLAREVLPAGHMATGWLGGTHGYMSPEQRDAITAVRGSKPVPAAVDCRSDVYSLGVLLYESLTGTLPNRKEEGRRRQEESNQSDSPPLSFILSPCSFADVSPGLAAIVSKCLAARPADRYPTAAGLSEDLRRYLNDLPLASVPNGSLTERWRKWHRRRPHALTVALLTAAVLAAGLGLGLLALHGVDQRRQQAEHALQEGERSLKDRAYGPAARALTRGLALAEELPFGQDLTERIRRKQQLARRAQAAQHLHTLADQLRYRIGTASLPKGSQDLGQQIREAWGRHGELLAHHDMELDSDSERQLSADLLDLGDLGIRLAPEPDRPRQPEPRSLGRAHLAAGRLDEAATAFELALDIDPHDFWSNFYLGVCAYRQNRFQEAVNSFRVCIALVPDSAPCYHNRGLAHEAAGDDKHALNDYSRALTIDPAHGPAALNRGLLYFKQKRHQDALDDLHRARQCSSDLTAVVWYNLALVHLDLKDRRTAMASLAKALEANPEHRDARTLLSRLEQDRKLGIP